MRALDARLTQAIGLALAGALLLAQAWDWPPAARLPLALLVFLLVPGLAVVLALRLRIDRLTAAALVLGLSISADLIGARVLLLLHVATSRNLILFLGGITLLCLLVSTYRSLPEGAASDE